MPDLERVVKDSVSTALFRGPRYARELYLALHPEDPAVTEDACRAVTLFDEDTIWEIHDYNIRKEALERGIEKGIHTMVTALRACSIGRDQVVRQVAEQYGMSPQEAQDAVARHWT